MRAAVIDALTNIVENIIVADASVDAPPRAGAILVNTDGDCSIGFVWDGSAFTDPNPKPKPEDLPPQVPHSITPRQCRLVLMQQGLLDTVEAMIAAQDKATQVTWEYALEFRRDDPLLNALAVSLNLTAGQIDAFFIEAAKL